MVIKRYFVECIFSGITAGCFKSNGNYNEAQCIENEMGIEHTFFFRDSWTYMRNKERLVR
jgi:hypothetical protein